MAILAQAEARAGNYDEADRLAQKLAAQGGGADDGGYAAARKYLVKANTRRGAERRCG